MISSRYNYLSGTSMTKLAPRVKRLLLIALLLACVVPFAPLGNSQWRHLRQVEKHIAGISPEWRHSAELTPVSRTSIYSLTPVVTACSEHTARFARTLT